MSKEKRGCFASLLLKLILLLILITVVLLIVLVVMITGPVVTYPAPTFDNRDTGVMANVVTRLARSLVDKEGRVVETAELRLTKNEVQTLINAMIRDDREDAPETVPYAVTWEDGMIRVFLSTPINSGKKAVNFFIEFAPYVDNGQLGIVPGAGTVGKLPMPRFVLNNAAQLIVKEAMKREKVRTAVSPFSRIEPGEKGSLVMMFDPRDVNAVVRVLRSAGGEEEADEEDDEDEDWDEEEDENEEVVEDEDDGAVDEWESDDDYVGFDEEPDEDGIGF